jgi:type I restriction enzyme S subunit
VWEALAMADNRKPKEQQGLPEGWKWVRLEEDIILITGSRPKGGAVEEGIPSLGGEHITEDGRIIFTEQNAKYIPDKFFKLMSKGKVEINDILMNKDGANTGKVAILKAKFHPHIAINEHLFILRSKKLFEQKYLFYWLYSPFAQAEIKIRITGSAQPGLSSNFIKNFFLPLPPLPEQRKIAQILETVDNAIEKTEKIIEKYKRIKQGLMQDLLTKGIDEKGNIRSEKTHKFKDSPLGRIPEEWEVVRLGEVGEIISGSTPSTYNSEYWNGEIVWITPDDLSKAKTLFIENSSRKITQKGLRSCSARIIPAYSVVISSRAPIGYVKVSKVPFTTSQGCKSIAYNGKFSSEFLAILLSNKVQDMINLGSGTTFQEITKSNLKNLPIPLPPLSEQKRIAEILSQIDQAIEKEEKYKQKLERLKKGLMEDLLTGKVRVNKLLEGESHEMA